MMLSRRPSGPLSAFVDMLWASERGAMPHAREANLPTGRADIVIPLRDDQCITRFAGSHDEIGERYRGGVVHGAHDRACQRDTRGASSVIGVHFKPGGAAAFFGGALSELRNRTVLLDDLWGASAWQLRDDLQATRDPRARLDLLEARLSARLRLAAEPDAMVAHALRSMALNPSETTIEPLRRASGCSPARFIARFEQAVGLTPKRYARVLRFNTLIGGLAHGEPQDWAQTAISAGYADQSHLIHEFKRLAGITPTAYRPVRPDHPSHFAVTHKKISNTR